MKITGKRISESTIHRLSLYYRLLSILEKEGFETISSRDLAEREKLTPAQVRKDLSFFGQFGTRGLGYPVAELRQHIAEILGINKKWNVALIGIGNVGSALVSYKEFQKQGFHIKLIFDNDQRKIGSFHKGIEVHDAKNLRQMLNKNNIEVVIIAVPAASAQQIIDEVIDAGVKAILSFAPINLRIPSHATLRTVNMAIEMEHLSFHLSNENLYYTA